MKKIIYFALRQRHIMKNVIYFALRQFLYVAVLHIIFIIATKNDNVLKIESCMYSYMLFLSGFVIIDAVYTFRK